MATGIQNVADVRVRVATTEAGPYTEVGFVRSIDFERGREGDTTIRWFGGDQVRPGGKTLSGTLPIFYSEDPTGQDILVTAYNTDTHVYLQFCPAGAENGAKVQQFETIISSVSTSADAEGDAVEGSFSFSGSPSTFKIVTLSGS